MKELLNPTLAALRKLGGSASISELFDQVVEDLKPNQEALERLHTGHTQKTELEYRLDWARTRLKWFGVIDNSHRGVWSLTTRGRQQPDVVPDEVMRISSPKRAAEGPQVRDGAAVAQIVAESEDAWRDALIETVLAMNPDAFERLCQRLLREAGFVKVEVRGGTGDEGIDGHGLLRVGGLVSLSVYFQCKRYRGSVGAPIVRNFRGAMAGRSQHGLLITTGHFTSDARAEASRQGAPLIDLIDGDELADKLREFRLGVEVEPAERIQIRRDWFDSI